MDDKNFNIDRIGDVFIYTMNIPSKVVNRINNDKTGVLEEFIDKKTLNVNINVPKKKIVICGGESLNYDESVTIFNSNYINNNTVVVDDIGKFDETHKKAYKILTGEHQK